MLHNLRQWAVSGPGKWSFLILMIVTLWIATATAKKTKPSNAEFDSIKAHSIALVDSQGRPRLLLAAPLPNPRVGGKEYPRSNPVYGFQFLDADGNETGGLALIDQIGGGAFCFDYSTAEAFCITKTRDSVYVQLLDPPAPADPVGKTGPPRIVISQEKGDASITISDHAGKDRIVLGVNKDAEAEMKMLDAGGRALFKEPH
jgi:hypothetical protein